MKYLVLLLLIAVGYCCGKVIPYRRGGGSGGGGSGGGRGYGPILLPPPSVPEVLPSIYPEPLPGSSGGGSGGRWWPPVYPKPEYGHGGGYVNYQSSSSSSMTSPLIPRPEPTLSIPYYHHGRHRAGGGGMGGGMSERMGSEMGSGMGAGMGGGMGSGMSSGMGGGMASGMSSRMGSMDRGMGGGSGGGMGRGMGGGYQSTYTYGYYPTRPRIYYPPVKSYYGYPYPYPYPYHHIVGKSNSIDDVGDRSNPSIDEAIAVGVSRARSFNGPATANVEIVNLASGDRTGIDDIMT